MLNQHHVIKILINKYYKNVLFLRKSVNMKDVQFSDVNTSICCKNSEDILNIRFEILQLFKLSSINHHNKNTVPKTIVCIKVASSGITVFKQNF